MSKLTVGYIEDLLRKYNKSTEVEVSCNCCHHSSIGHTSILKVRDNTDQTYGYIELELNSNNSPADVENIEDKKDFYEGEIKRLKREVEILKNKLKIYNEFEEDVLNSIKRHCEMVDRRLRWEDEK